MAKGPKITNARVVAPRAKTIEEMFSTPLGKVFITLEGETKEQELFEFYQDEISFHPSEFIGLTIDDANKVRHGKSVAYLRS